MYKIHVNQHVIRRNAKSGEKDPPLTVKRGRNNNYAHEVQILDELGNVCASVVYADGVNRKPLSCGARVWIETNGMVRLIDWGIGAGE